ncbi:MAG: DNA-binding domain-containing protein [Marinifilaceae bacterium]|jgi:hypothetical protein
MSLKYGLIRNHLTEAEDDYMGMVTDNETVTTEKIVDKMVSRGSTVTKAEALSVIEEFSHAIVDSIANGNNVNTELFRIHPSISGVFTDENDGYDKTRHSIRLKINAGPRLAEATSKIELRKVEITGPQPAIKRFVDLNTKVENESFHPGHFASIKGTLLKFEEEDSNQGIFFIAADSTETRVTNIARNKPSELMFYIPESLTPGTYQVEVRTIYNNYKSMRSGRLGIDLTALS